MARAPGRRDSPPPWCALVHVRRDLDPVRLRRPGLHRGGPHAPRPPDRLPRRRDLALGHDRCLRLRRRPRGPARPGGGAGRGLPHHERRGPDLGRHLPHDRAGGGRGAGDGVRALRALIAALYPERGGSLLGRQGLERRLRQREDPPLRPRLPAARDFRRGHGAIDRLVRRRSCAPHRQRGDRTAGSIA